MIEKTEQIILSRGQTGNRAPIRERSTSVTVPAKPKAPEKWCSIHKSRFHNTSECRENSSKYRNTSKFENSFSNSKHSSSSAILLRQPDDPIGIITLEGYIKKTKLDFIIDSGAENSLISERIVKELDVEIEIINKITVQTANFKNIHVTQKATIEFQLKEVLNDLFKHEALILPNNSVDSILGSDFLTTQKCVIDYRRGIIRIQDSEIEITSTRTQQWTSSRIECL